MKRKSFFILSLFLLCVLAAQAIETKLPPSFKYDKAALTIPTTYHMEFKEDVQKLLEEDQENARMAMPLRIAVGTGIHIDIDRQSLAQTFLPSGEQVWRYAIQSNEAKGLIITFSELYIPEGDELYIYTKDRRQINLFTHETNPSGGIYATDAMLEDEIVFEYVSSSQSQELSRIKIADIAYIYKSLSSIEEDLSCYININCSEGDNWQLQKNGVIRLLIQDYVGGGWGACSGSLINNVREDGTPYILTANHCISGSEVMSTLKFEFFREATDEQDCHIQTENSPYTKTLTGATLTATTPINGSSDGTLLKINGAIPEDWEVYYNGWDARDSVIATSGVSIHHPNRYVKKISVFTSPLVSAGNLNMGGWPPAITGSDAHWEVIWTPTEHGFSVTYGGSSGSPLFNQDGLIVGTLTGGGSYCSAPYAPDYYGKFSYHWDKHSSSQQHFKNYLDPDNTGKLVLNGFDPHELTLEGKPEALDATDITPVGFTANWEKLENAKKYYLDIYQKKEGGAIEYLNGFQGKDVGNVLSYAITDLDHATEYWYVVKAGYGSQITEPSDEINVTTQPPTFEYFYPEATDATHVTAESFSANWEALPGATSYRLNVYQKIPAIDLSETVDFTDKKIPEGWKKNSVSYYSEGEDFETSAPALRLGNDEYIESPEYEEVVKSLKFWYRGVSAHQSNRLVISGYIANKWTEIKRIVPVLNTTEGNTVVISPEELVGCTAIKILHQKVSGNVAIDDIVVNYGTFPYTRYVRELNNYDVSNTTSYSVPDLESESDYYYSIVGYNGEKYSKESNEVVVKTNIQLGIKPLQSENKRFFRIDKEAIYIHTDVLDKTNVLIFNIVGQAIISHPLSQQDVYISRKGFPSGIYFIKIGEEIYKVFLR